MSAARAEPKDIDDYIAGFPPEVRKLLQRIRATIRKAAPDAEEAIRYQIPTFRLNGNLIHFAAFQGHIGLYPAPRGDAAFKDELARYEGGKGTVRFPLDQPIPLDLIRRIVKFRVAKELEKAKKKRGKQ
ncbi:MAG TPA: DUF1801 domain-containing protein [Thermoanaerobaculia bacterium]|nr:DUF1801 domain-containing protein [Thermoanaerobaculia bacterium]